jgi:hypothetical protein
MYQEIISQINDDKNYLLLSEIKVCGCDRKYNYFCEFHLYPTTLHFVFDRYNILNKCKSANKFKWRKEKYLIINLSDNKRIYSQRNNKILISLIKKGHPYLKYINEQYITYKLCLLFIKNSDYMNYIFEDIPLKYKNYKFWKTSINSHKTNYKTILINGSFPIEKINLNVLKKYLQHKILYDLYLNSTNSIRYKIKKNLSYYYF